MKKKSNDPREAKRPPRPARDKIVADVRSYLSAYEINDIYYNSFISKSTIRNLKIGKTMFPRNSTIDTTLGAMGLERRIVKKGSR